MRASRANKAMPVSSAARVASIVRAKLPVVDEHTAPEATYARQESCFKDEIAPIPALQEAVTTLSRHLTSLCANASGIDPAQIAEAAEALSRTCRSLEDVKALYA